MENNENREVALQRAMAVNAVVVTTLAGAGPNMVGYTPPEFSYARWSFIAAAFLLGIGGGAWLIITDQSLPWRVFWGVLLGLAVFVAFPSLMRWVNVRQDLWAQSQIPQPQAAFAQAPPPAADEPPPAPNPPPRALTDESASRTALPSRRELTAEQERVFWRQLYNADFYKYASAFDLFRSPVAGDAEGYAREFERLFGGIGIHLAVNTKPPSGPNQTGLMVSVRDPRRPSPGAVILKEALEAAGLEARYIPLVSAQSVSGRNLEFALYVGPAPEAQQTR